MDGDAHPKKAALIAQRELIIAQLTDAFSKDEIGLASFEERVGAAYLAETAEELGQLVSDLIRPSASEASGRASQAEMVTRRQAPIAMRTWDAPLAASSPSSLAPSPPAIRSVLASVVRTLGTDVAPVTRVDALFGNLELDLRDSRFLSNVTELRVSARCGSIEIVVPADINVEIEGGALLGNFEGEGRKVADENAPTVRITGYSFLGSVEVRIAPPRRVEHLAKALLAKRS